VGELYWCLVSKASLIGGDARLGDRERVERWAIASVMEEEKQWLCKTGAIAKGCPSHVTDNKFPQIKDETVQIFVISRQWKLVWVLKPDTRVVHLKNGFGTSFRMQVCGFKHGEPGMIHTHLLKFQQIS